MSTTLTPAQRTLDRLLAPPLQPPWREDIPDLYPFCVECGRSIKPGDRYRVAKDNHVFCKPCVAAALEATP